MRRHAFTAAPVWYTGGVRPLFVAVGALCGGIEGVPYTTAGALPVGAPVGFPTAFGAGDFYVSHFLV